MNGAQNFFSYLKDSDVPNIQTELPLSNGFAVSRIEELPLMICEFRASVNVQCSDDDSSSFRQQLVEESPRQSIRTIAENIAL